jgi:hypothetical protein
MSFKYGRTAAPIRVENGNGYVPVLGPDGEEHEVVVKPDADVSDLLINNATADGPDALLRMLLERWFTKNQSQIDGTGWIFRVRRSELEEFV